MEAKSITKRREELGLTKEDLAQKVGVSVNTIRLWEKGISEPREKNREKLEAVLQSGN